MSDEKIDLIKNNPWLCTSPYWQVQIKQRWEKTNWSPCCDYDVYCDENSKQSFSTIENLKSLIEKKEIDKKCRRCHDLEKSGGISERMRYLLYLPTEKIKNFINTPELLKTQIDNTPMVSIKVSNTCNLACRSCFGSESSLYNKLFNDYNLTYNLWKNPEDEEFFKEYLKNQCETNDKVMLHVLGGEVFLNDYIGKILKWCKEQSILNKICLHITTNNQIPLERKLLNLSKSLKSIYLSLSIDSIGENYSYVRWPGKFSKVEENLLNLEHLRTRELSGKLTYSITPVFSLNNIFYIEDYLDYWLIFAKKHGFKNLSIYNFHLHNPDYLMIENLPSNYKKLLIPILEKCFNHEIFNFLNDTKQLKQWLISIVDNLKNTNISDEKFKVYLKYTTEYDQKTNQDSFILNSKLFDILTDEHKDYYRLNKNIKNDHRVRWLGKE